MIWAFKVHLKYMLAQGQRKSAAQYFALRGTTHSQQPSFHFEKLSLSAAGCTGLKICCFRKCGSIGHGCRAEWTAAGRFEDGEQCRQPRIKVGAI